MLETAWAKGLSPRPSLDPDALWAKALRSAPAAGELGGRTKAGAADFRLRLEMLAQSLEREARLNPLGLTIAHGLLVRTIRQRLHLGQYWLDNPQVLAQPIAPPVIIVGHMRSGTTRIHRLLAADPAHAATRFCDSWSPVPRTPDTRPLWSALSLFAARQINPWLDSIHPFGVTRPDEELGWLAGALDHCAYEAQWRIPAFTAFSEARDPKSVYREFARILRTDAAVRGNAHQARVLKVPQFTEDLPALLAQFPDACVIHTHRDSEDIVQSAVSLVANQMTIQSEFADLAWIEAECRRKIALREVRMDKALGNFSGPLALVEYDALDAYWEGAIAKAYGSLGLRLSAQALEAMRAEQQRSKSSPHHLHQKFRRKLLAEA